MSSTMRGTALSTKIQENRVRNMAKRQGLELQKSRRRDPKALGFGGYMLIDIATNTVITGADPYPHSLTLDDAEAWLSK